MSDDLRAIVHAAILTPTPLARYQPYAPRRERHGDVMLFQAGRGDDAFREVIVVGPEPPERVFALAREFFGEEASFNVVVEVESAGPTDAALKADGWRVDEEEPALVLAPLPSSVPSPPSDLAVHPVADEAGLDDFHVVTGGARRWVPSVEAARDPGVGLFVGYRDGRPVATARFTIQQGVADITGVATVPEERRRGYGTALTWAAVAEAARRGATAAELTATEMGYPVYVKMGFAPVCTYRTYVRDRE